MVLEENPGVGVGETDYNYSLGYQLPILPSLGVGLSLYSNSTAITLVNALGSLPGEEGAVTTKGTRIVPAPTLGLLLHKSDSSLVYDIYGG